MTGDKIIAISLLAFSVISLVSLGLIKADVDLQSKALCTAYADNMDQCPVHNSNISWFIVAAFASSFLMLGIGGYLLLMPRLLPKPQPIKEKKEFKEIDLAKLDDEERKIYEIIKDRGGSAFQSDLIKETGFNKAKVTRVLDKLELADVLERKRRGMTNIIVLK